MTYDPEVVKDNASTSCGHISQLLTTSSALLGGPVDASLEILQNPLVLIMYPLAMTNIAIENGHTN